MTQDLVLLRYMDKRENRLSALCRPVRGADVLRRVFEVVDEEDEEWLVESEKAGVLVGTSGTIFVTSPSDLHLLAFWFSMAAAWLESETLKFDVDHLGEE